MTSSKKAPTWAMIAGILGICFGALGLLGGTYEIMMPTILSIQKQMMEHLKESLASEQKEPCPDDEGKAVPRINPEAAFEAMQKLFAVPPWYKSAVWINGGLQSILGALYILASIFLTLVKRGAATFFISVAAISAVRNVAAAGLGMSAGSFITLWTLISGIVGFLIDLVLIIVVAVSDRSMYRSSASN